MRLLRLSAFVLDFLIRIGNIINSTYIIQYVLYYTYILVNKTLQHIEFLWNELILYLLKLCVINKLSARWLWYLFLGI